MMIVGPNPGGGACVLNYWKDAAKIPHNVEKVRLVGELCKALFVKRHVLIIAFDTSDILFFIVLLVLHAAIALVIFIRVASIKQVQGVWRHHFYKN